MTQPANFAEHISHLRHDLIKHLDVPSPGANMSRAAWDVLQRRLYAEETGIVNMGRSWLVKLRGRWADFPALDEALDDLQSSLQAIEKCQGDVADAAKNASPADEALVNALKQLVAVVRNIEAEGAASSEDEDATLDFLLAEDEEDEQDVPPLPVPNAGQSKRRVLVVDDRLQSVERFHATDHMRERFEWVRLCELEGPCWECPHQEGCGMRRARTFRELESALRRAQSIGRPIDVILMDVRFDDVAAGELLPTPPGFDVDSVEATRALQGPLMVRAVNSRPDLPTTPVVLMTGRGALPAGSEKLLEGLDGIHFVDDEASLEALTARLDAVARRGSRPVTEGAYFWGRSPVMQAVREEIELLALGPRPVLLTGPSGSGKSFLVEEVLLPLSGRSHLVTLDLSAVPETLVESELFGHVKGAFSGAEQSRKGLIEEASGGILFLDEIGHLSPENQRRLLLFLQDRQVRRVGASHSTRHKVDVKVVCATHMDLREEVEEGNFRFDLYMRLRPATQIRLPSLAERPEDLDGMMRHLVDRLASGPELAPYVREVARARGIESSLSLVFGHETPPDEGMVLRLPQPTAAALRNHTWPGNTRELEAVLDTLLLRALADARLVDSGSNILEVDHYLALKLLGIGRPRNTGGRPLLTLPIEPANDLKQMRHRLERAYLVEAFRTAEGDMERMTELVLGSGSSDDRHRLTVRMNQLGLKVTELKMTT